jgi:hypothetical protein
MLGETLRIEPDGRDALRIRARPGLQLAQRYVSALLPPPSLPAKAQIEIADTGRRAEANLALDCCTCAGEHPAAIMGCYLGAWTCRGLRAERLAHAPGLSLEDDGAREAGR